LCPYAFRDSNWFVCDSACSSLRNFRGPPPASVPIGVILQAGRANGSAEIAGTGSAIYAGDRLKTEDGEQLRVRLGFLQLSIWKSTVVEVGGLPNNPSATLVSGTIVIASPESQTFQLLADGITIRPLGAQRSEIQVTWVNAHQLEVSSKRGGIQLSLDDEIQTVMTGESYRIEIETEKTAPQGPAGSGKGATPTGRNHFTKYLIAGGTIATVIGIWRAFVSPCAP